jgi:hypothetical protein
MRSWDYIYYFLTCYSYLGFHEHLSFVLNPPTLCLMSDQHFNSLVPVIHYPVSLQHFHIHATIVY